MLSKFLKSKVSETSSTSMANQFFINCLRIVFDMVGAENVSVILYSHASTIGGIDIFYKSYMEVTVSSAPYTTKTYKI
jgi:hypothetical protein